MSPSFFLALFALLAVTSADSEVAYKYRRATDVFAALNKTPRYSSDLMTLVDIGGISYFFSEQLMSWAESVYFCEAYGMDLVSLETEVENNAIEQYLVDHGSSGKIYWASGNKIGNPSTMVWILGTILSYRDFANGHPGGYNCMVLQNRVWYGRDCSVTALPICELAA